jgi:hypothetical protein
MIYECLFLRGAFLIAKPLGWMWSPAERAEPFEIRLTEDLTPGEVEFVVDTGGTPVDASRIDATLVRKAPKWPS